MHEEDLRELLLKLSATIGNIIAFGKRILNAEADDEFNKLRSEINAKLPNTDQRIRVVALIVVYCAYQVCIYVCMLHCNNTINLLHIVKFQYFG